MRKGATWTRLSTPTHNTHSTLYIPYHITMESDPLYQVKQLFYQGKYQLLVHDQS